MRRGKLQYMRTVAPFALRPYSHAGIAAPNPHAVTQIANGVSTTTFSYDSEGNLISSGNGTATTTYTYDYANRLTALNAGGATTTYGYDSAGQRVIQTGTSTTWLYPFQWYSVASSTGTGAKYSTTTEYVLNGDTLIATVDRQFSSGVATGTAKTRYVHPDHLGSTDVVTDENRNLVQTLSFYPYGATRISIATSTRERRQFIGQFTDDSTLSYLNARYMDPSRGQFTTEEPIFLNIGDATQVKKLSQQDQQAYLTDPQALNAYSYGRDNPITRKDSSGKFPALAAAPALLFPEISAPVIIVGATVVGISAIAATYYNTPALLRQSGGREYGRLDKGQGVSLPGAPSLFPEGEPPKIPDSKWLKWGLVGTGVVDLSTYLYDLYKDYSKSLQDLKTKQQQSPQMQMNLTNGGSSYRQGTQSSASYTFMRYTTPNGAVVDWYGNVVFQPANKK
jgi:RHS repeat-associated protein